MNNSQLPPPRMNARRFAAEAGMSEQEAAKELADALIEKEYIDKLNNNEFLKGMEEKSTKILSIKAKCGTQERELSFPVPAEMLEWIEQIELPTSENENDPKRFCVEGSRKIQLSISLMDLRRKF